MASAVCTTAAQAQQLAAILDTNEGDYNWTVAGVPSTDPAYIRLFQAYTDAEIHGAANYYAYLDPNGRQPFVIGQMTILAALTDKAIADAIQFRYTVQSINTTQVLLNLRMSGLYNSAIGYSGSLYNAAIAHSNSLYNSALGYSQQLYNAGLANTAATARQLQGSITGAYNSSISYAQQLYNLSVANADTLYNSAIQNTAAVAHSLQLNIDQVASEVTGLVGTDIPQILRDITNTANTAELQLQNGVAQAEAVATGLAASAGASAVAKAVAALQPQIDAIKTETTQCLDPLCDTVTPNAKQLGNLGKLLTGATDALLLGGLLAFLAECAHDPQAAASEAESVLGGLVHDAETGVRDLVGV